MSITVNEVKTKKDLHSFVTFPFQIYRGNNLWVPQLIRDDKEVFNPDKNPAFEFAESRQFLATRDGQVVGRIAAILSHIANQKYQTKNMRFGWFESIDDQAVANALFDAVAAWARERGMESMTGPHGFCDLDPQGLMVEGFNELPTIAGYYNPDYYPRLFEGYGLRKEIDYLEFKSTVPYETGIPEKLLSICERVKQRGNFHIIKFGAKRTLIKRWAKELFHLLDDSFEEIYGSVPLSERQVNYYIKKYFTFVDKDLIKAVANEKGEMIGFMITFPSLSRGFQKAKGKLFPFGWFHILRSLRQHEIIDFYLAGIKKNYRGLGVDLLMVIEITKTAMAKGFKYAESNQELETNLKVQAQWKYFNPVQHKRKRIYRQEVGRG